MSTLWLLLLAETVAAGAASALAASWAYRRFTLQRRYGRLAIERRMISWRRELAHWPERTSPCEQ